jgi:hypothetical protein
MQNTGSTSAKMYHLCSTPSRGRFPSVNLAAIRVFRPGVSQPGTASVSRLSRRFYPAFLDRSAFAAIRTLYKRKAEKVLPVNQPRLKAEGPGGERRWKEKVLEQEKELLRDRPLSKWDEWLIPRFAKTPEGTRLTPERFANLKIGKELRPQEREVLNRILLNREMAISWEFKEMGRVRPEVAPPQEIHTVAHEPWRAPNFPVPKALHKTVCDMLRERLEKGTLEYCNGPYRNPWFLVKKKTRGYRLINAAMNINKVTIKDANLPPNPDEFAEEMAGMQIGSLIDFYSGYDQLELDEKYRDMTAIMTPLGLLRQTTVLMGATNSVSQFQRVVTKILEEHIPHITIPFMDDIGVRGPKDRYNDEEVPGLPGVRKFVMEHLRNLDAVLADLERAGVTISAEKSKFCMKGMKVVGYVCDADGRHPDASKVIKILEWQEPGNITEARAFIGVCVYYRIWIPDFAQIAAPIYYLFKVNVPFNWEDEQKEAMAILQEALTTAPALVSICYDEGAGEIILAPDASLLGWGGVLMQLDKEGRRHPARYESGIWSEAEKKYDAGKRECRGLLKLLKKVRQYLYGVRFVVETDAKTLVAQLNRGSSDLPGALVTRWIAWIQLFDFDVRHVPGKEHTAADGLSRRPATVLEEQEAAQEEDIDDFIAAQLSVVNVRAISVSPQISGAEGRVYPLRRAQEDTEMELAPDSLHPGYSEESQQYATFLTTLGRPDGMHGKEFRKFKAEALKFFVQDGHLFRRASKNVPIRRVVDDPADRETIMKALHEDSGHRGREGTYRRVADRYWWKSLAKDVFDHCRTCEACQKREPGREEEALHPTYVSVMWKKVAIDLVLMPPVNNYKYLAVLREDLSGWVEAKPLVTKAAKTVAKFLWEVICRFGIFGDLIVDGGTEFKDVVAELTAKYGIHRVQASAYHPQANGMVERGHRPIVDALAKLSAEGKGNWLENLNAVLFADRATVKVTTGVSPMRMNYGYEPLLPIESRISTRSYLEWRKAKTTAELLRLRALQFQRRDEQMTEWQLRQRRKREEGKEYFDSTKRIRAEPIRAGDLVLLHNTQREKDMTRQNKLNFRWLGPYRVVRANPNKGSFTLAEVDGTELGGTVSGNRLKLFHPRPEGFSITQGENDVDEEEGAGRTAQESDSDDAQGASINSEGEEIEVVPAPRQRRLPRRFREHW